MGKASFGQPKERVFLFIERRMTDVDSKANLDSMGKRPLLEVY